MGERRGPVVGRAALGRDFCTGRSHRSQVGQTEGSIGIDIDAAKGSDKA